MTGGGRRPPLPDQWAKAAIFLGIGQQSATAARVGGVETRMAQMEHAHRALAETMQRILNAQASWASSAGSPWRKPRESLVLVPDAPTVREQTSARLGRSLDLLDLAGDAYERLDAITGLRAELAETVHRARQAGERTLGQALFMLRDAVHALRAEELRPEQVSALHAVVALMAARDLNRDDLGRTDEMLLEADLEWVPAVSVEE